MILLIAAFLPALILLGYVYGKDSNPEPVGLVVKAFFYGFIAAFLAVAVASPFKEMGLFPESPETFKDCLKISFLGAAIPEESAKLLMLWLLLRRCKEFDESYDGIVYAAAVGLGFAALENVLYLVGSGSHWVSVSISRAFLAVPGHFAFAIAMGYYYSRRHFYGHSAPFGTTVNILLVPVLLHGFYDTLAFLAGLNEYASGLVTLLLILFCIRLFKFTRRRIRQEAIKNEDFSVRRGFSSFWDDTPDEQ